MRILVTVYSFIVLSASSARADDATDLGSLIADTCENYDDTKQAQKIAAATADERTKLQDQQSLCTKIPSGDLPSLRGAEYPRQFYKIKYGIDACALLKTVKSALKTELDESCGGASTRPTGLAFGAVAVDIVGGLGDLLQVQAKQAALQFFLERIGKQFCNYKVSVPGGSPIEMKVWFKKSCEVMLPKGSVDVDAFSFGGLKTAFMEDLEDLPEHALAVATARFATEWSATATHYVTALGALTSVMEDIADGSAPLDLLIKLGTGIEPLKGKLACNLTAATGVPKECVLALAFVFARTAALELRGGASVTVRLAKIIGDTVEQFCAEYGANTLAAGAACIVNATTYTVWHERLRKLYASVQRFRMLHWTLITLAHELLPAELDKRAAPELLAAVGSFVDSVSDVLGEAVPLEKDAIEDDFALLALAIDAYGAIVENDPAMLRKVLIDILTSDAVASKLDPASARTITIIVSLATAKDRDEVKGILEEVTAPTGTYKAKYNAERAVVMLNGFVGFFAGAEIRLHSRNSDGTDHEPFREWAPLKLSAPVGVDVTVSSGTYCHFGFTGTLIDPLALVVSTDEDTLSAEWKTLFTPGLYARFGVARSPFTVLVGGNFQWARRSDEMCGTDRCFDGAFQIGAFLSADVPLFVLR